MTIDQYIKHAKANKSQIEPNDLWIFKVTGLIKILDLEPEKAGAVDTLCWHVLLRSKGMLN